MLTVHHIGNLVEDIDTSLETYKLIFGDNCASDKIYVSSQGVYVCFVNIGKGILMELVQPVDENSVVFKMRKKGVSYYHIAYTTNTFDKTSEFLESCNFKTMNTFYSEAFDNKRCQFMCSPEGNLIELIEI